MTHLVCPLCGGSKPLAKLDLSGAPPDIYLQEFRGLGRGRGFAVKRRKSALPDREMCEQIRDRAAAVVALIDGAYGGAAQPGADTEYVQLELEEARGREAGLTAEIGRLREELREREGELDGLRRRLENLRGQLEEEAVRMVEVEEAHGDLVGRAAVLLRALGPLLEQVEYLAYDEESLADLLEEVEEAVGVLDERIKESD